MLIDTCQFQGHGIDCGQVQIATPEGHRVVGCHGIEVVPGRHPVLRPVGFVPALAQNPPSGRGFLHSRLHQVQEFAEVFHFGKGQILPPYGPVVVMKMGVGHAGENQPSAEIQDVGLRAGQSFDFIVTAHGQDTALPDGDRLDDRTRFVLGTDIAIYQNKFRFHRYSLSHIKYPSGKGSRGSRINSFMPVIWALPRISATTAGMSPTFVSCTRRASKVVPRAPLFT